MDDIDIEEHDLLDNPVIRSIFPDLSILKSEIESYDEAITLKPEDSITPQQLLTGNDDYLAEPIISKNEKEICNVYSLNSDITKSEPCFGEKELNLCSNRIILGTKPIAHNEIKTIGQLETDKIYAAKVHVTDVACYLNNNDRFCATCLILFPQRKCLDVHRKEMHNDEKMKKKHAVTRESKRMKNLITRVRQGIYNCQKCGASFASNVNLVHHLWTTHHIRYRNISKFKNTPQISQNPTSADKYDFNANNKCFHCKVFFPTKKLLIEHIYKILQSKKKVNGNKKINNEQPECVTNHKPNQTTNKHERNKSNTKKNIVRTDRKIKTLKDVFIYRCMYCTYCFVNMSFCIKHIQNKHKDMNISNLKRVKYNEQCKFCSTKNRNWKIYNSHLHKCHIEKIRSIYKIDPKICISKIELSLALKPHQERADDGSESIETLNFLKDMKRREIHCNTQIEDSVNEDFNKSHINILKSILFKCTRCDIHFISANCAIDHKNHMEMLINWKCMTCLRIFKKDDSTLHETQHLHSRKINVIEIYPSEKILFKCAQCAIHFNEDNYYTHSETCGSIMAESVYCKDCDLLIDKNISRDHTNDHKIKKNVADDFKIIYPGASNAIKLKAIENSSIARPETVKNKTNNLTIQRRNQKKTVKLPVICSEIKKMFNGKTFPQDICFKLSYCETCKSFVTPIGLTRSVHVESRCAHMVTYVCKYCGLILTNKALSTHKVLHQKRPDLKLQDFTFHNIHDGKQILPPLPIYPQCHKCDVYFISKKAVSAHLCNDNDYLSCYICHQKFSDCVFKLHMSFHFYINTLNKKATAIPLEPLETSKKRENSDQNLIDTHMSMTALEPNKENTEAQGKRSFEGNLELERDSIDLNTQKTCISTIKTKTIIEKCQVSPTEESNNVQSMSSLPNMETDYELYDVLYCCFNCRLSIDTYDKVVEHCQDHLCNVTIEVEVCKICKLRLDKRTYNTHHNIHHDPNKTKFSLEILTFDIFYFSMDNTVWINHVFRSMNKEKRESILKRSIYQVCRRKMRIIQNGFANMTLFKCGKCSVIIDLDGLLKHIENSCFPIRKYPCSFCGLPFLSYLARLGHEKIHEFRSVTLEDFRIVLFNEEDYKMQNKSIAAPNEWFIIYQCRNCNGVIDKYQKSEHTCNNKYLKLCDVCNLMIFYPDYKSHCRKHEIAPNFIPKNMKIILFGKCNSELSSNITSKQESFAGIIVDYTLYRCIECEVCFEKTHTDKLYHNKCCDDSSKIKCPKCDLLISSKKFKQHSKSHDCEPDFVKENINIISYSISEVQANFIPAESTLLLGKTPIIKADKTELPQIEQVKESDPGVAKLSTLLFKCICGLHFVDSSSIQAHFSVCNPRLTNCKQKCSKCNLLFTPNVLFDHLLVHHGDKKQIYDFNIVEMDKTKCKIVTLFNCLKCNTNFTDIDIANEHYKECSEINISRHACRICSLYFDHSSIELHERDHHQDDVAYVNTIEIGDGENQKIKLQPVDISRVNTITYEADRVIDPKMYNISDDCLAQIDLSKYDKTIFKCELCNTHFISENTIKRHIANKHYLSPQKACDNCGLNFSLHSFTKHDYIHHQKMQLQLNDLVIKRFPDNLLPP